MMEYGEALDIVGRLRTQYQAYEKMDEVLKKAQGAENHTKELESRRDGLVHAVEVEKGNLENLRRSNSAMAAEHEARVNQLKKAEAAAIKAKTEAEASLSEVQANNHREHLKQMEAFAAEKQAIDREFNEQIAKKKAELVDLQNKITKMKELARSVA